MQTGAAHRLKETITKLEHLNGVTEKILNTNKAATAAELKPLLRKNPFAQKRQTESKQNAAIEEIYRDYRLYSIFHLSAQCEDLKDYTSLLSQAIKFIDDKKFAKKVHKPSQKSRRSEQTYKNKLQNEENKQELAKALHDVFNEHRNIFKNNRHEYRNKVKLVIDEMCARAVREEQSLPNKKGSSSKNKSAPTTKKIYESAPEKIAEIAQRIQFDNTQRQPVNKQFKLHSLNQCFSMYADMLDNEIDRLHEMLDQHIETASYYAAAINDQKQKAISKPKTKFTLETFKNNKNTAEKIEILQSIMKTAEYTKEAISLSLDNAIHTQTMIQPDLTIYDSPEK